MSVSCTCNGAVLRPADINVWLRVLANVEQLLPVQSRQPRQMAGQVSHAKLAMLSYQHLAGQASVSAQHASAGHPQLLFPCA